MSEATPVKPQGTVDIKRTESATTAAANAPEESMAEYASRREAEMRGETPEPKPAAVVETTTTAAPAQSTVTAAAATEDEVIADKTAPESATEEPVVEIEKTHPARKGIENKFSKLTSARDKALAEAAVKTAEAEQAKRETAEAKAEVERLKAEATQAAILVVSKAEEDPVPDRTAFEDPDKYEQAVIAHTARQEIRKANEAAETAAKERQAVADKKVKEEQQARVQEQITALHKTFNERVEAAKPDYPDYAEKVTNNEKLILRNDIFFTIEQSEQSPHILYYLADHHEEAATLNTLSPIAAALRLGRMEAEIAISRKPKVSKAAAPERPVGNRSSPERKTRDEMSVAEYEKQMIADGAIPDRTPRARKAATH